MDEFNAEGSSKFLFLLSTRGKFCLRFLSSAMIFNDPILHENCSLFFQLEDLVSILPQLISLCFMIAIGILKSIFKQVSSFDSDNLS